MPKKSGYPGQARKRDSSYKPVKEVSYKPVNSYKPVKEVSYKPVNNGYDADGVIRLKKPLNEEKKLEKLDLSEVTPKELSDRNLILFDNLRPEDYEVCESCSNLKIRALKCQVCDEWVPEEYLIISKSKTDARRLKVTEERILDPKKSTYYNKYNKEDFLFVGSIRNRRGEIVTSSMPRSDPGKVVSTVIGGIHRISHVRNIEQMSHELRMAKMIYKEITGKRYKAPHKKKIGRPGKNDKFKDI